MFGRLDNVWKQAAYFSGLVKMAHTVFALPFALIGFFLGIMAKETADTDMWKNIGWVIACVFFARNAAMGFNRWTDVGIDTSNERTRNRELVTGVIQKKHSLYFVIINGVFFIGATFFINRLCFFLSPVALLVILGYSYTKRFTTLCHFILGLGLALAPIGAFLAVIPVFKLYVVLLSFAVIFWVSGFDIIYALQDRVFDKEHKLFSIPAVLGMRKALLLSKILHLLTLVLLFLLGYIVRLNVVYWIGYAIFSVLLVHQHYLVRGGNLEKINMAFFTNNGLASLLFGVCTITDLLLGK